MRLLLLVVLVFSASRAEAYSKECLSSLGKHIQNQYKVPFSDSTLAQLEATFYPKNFSRIDDYCLVHQIDGAFEAFFPKLRWQESQGGSLDTGRGLEKVEGYLSQLESNDDQLDEIFSIRIPNWHFHSRTISHKRGQRVYRQRTLRAIRNAYRGILNQGWDLSDTLYFLAQERFDSARQVHEVSTGEELKLPRPGTHSFEYGFGTLRVLDGRTPIVDEGPYAHLKAPVRALFEKKYVNLDQTWREISFRYEGKKITEFLSNQNYCDILHTNPYILYPFLKTVALPLFEKIKTTRYATDAALLKDLGHLHWLLAHLMPYYRGSAAISENLVRSLFLLHGKKLQRYRVNTLPDLESLIESDPDRFSGRYGSQILEGVIESIGPLLPEKDDRGFIPTLNKHGWMATQLDPVSLSFLEYVRSVERPVLDIGTAYGFSAHEALKRGARVIANDIEPRHLAILSQSVEDGLKGKLELNYSRFPEPMEFAPNSLDAVLACRVFHFLSGEELEIGVRKLFTWLAPGGKVFVFANAPFRKNLNEFLKDYEEMKTKTRYPGVVKSLETVNREQASQLPEFFHYLDVDVMARLFKEAGFKVEWAEYIKLDTIPDSVKLDGRENVGLIAVKP